jgi:NAD+ kinase
MNRIGIIYHPLKESRGLSVWLCSAWEGDTARKQVDGTDLILSIGGDGTILRAAQAVVPKPTPITGINLGNLGFMTELSVDEAEEKLTQLLAGEGWIDERYLLEAEVPATEETPEPQRFYALNDVVITHGAAARVIYVEASIDGELVTTYKADGVIVSTATGSTGYSLAADGPILHSQAQEMLLLPIVPHLSASYKLVLPPTSTVGLRVNTDPAVTLTVDGHITTPLPSGTTVNVRHSKNTLRFLRIHTGTSFFGSLDERLKGKQR